MGISYQRILALAIVGSASTWTSASAAIKVWVDMDPASPGIQRSMVATEGQSLPVDLLIELSNTYLSVYSVSLRYDTIEVDFVGDSMMEYLPQGFDFHITPAGPALSPDTGTGWRKISAFEAATHTNGPNNGLLLIGTLDFRVGSVLDDDHPDITVGLFGSVDRFANNSIPYLNPSFMPGYIVPEPSSLLLFAPLLIFATSRR